MIEDIRLESLSQNKKSLGNKPNIWRNGKHNKKTFSDLQSVCWVVIKVGSYH